MPQRDLTNPRCGPHNVPAGSYLFLNATVLTANPGNSIQVGMRPHATVWEPETTRPMTTV